MNGTHLTDVSEYKEVPAQNKLGKFLRDISDYIKLGPKPKYRLDEKTPTIFSGIKVYKTESVVIKEPSLPFHDIEIVAEEDYSKKNENEKFDRELRHTTANF